VAGIVLLIVISITWVVFFGGLWVLVRSRRSTPSEHTG
jgi:hypothetical protein